MTLKEFRKKVKSVEETHPAPKTEDMVFYHANRHYRKIIDNWAEELNPEDKAIIGKENRQFARKMGS